MRSFHTHNFADRFYTIILKRDPTNLENVKHEHLLFKKDLLHLYEFCFQENVQNPKESEICG